MFLYVIAISIYILAITAMFYMDTVYKAFLFFMMVFIFTFVLFLFINYPMPSAMGVICFIALFTFKMKD